MKFILLIFIFITLLSCNKVDSYEKYWLGKDKDGTEVFIEFNKDSIILYPISYTVCDTFMSEKIVLNQSNKEGVFLVNNTTDTITAKFQDVENLGNSVLLLSSKMKQKYFLAFPDSSFLRIKERKNRDNYYVLAKKVESSLDNIKILSQNNVLSKEAENLVRYINNLKLHIYQKLNIDTSKLNCIQHIDSLFSYRMITDVMVGNPIRPHERNFSASVLKNKISNYLVLIDNKEAVNLFFKNFDEELNDFVHDNGSIEQWECYYFYGMPLWSTILQLNDFQSNIIKLDLLVKENYSLEF